MSVVVVLQPRLWHFYGKAKVGRDSIFDITRPQIWTPTNGWDRDMKPSLAIKDHSIDKLFLWGGDWYPLLSHQTHIRQTYHLLIGRWSVWFHTCSPGKKNKYKNTVKYRFRVPNSSSNQHRTFDWLLPQSIHDLKLMTRILRRSFEISVNALFTFRFTTEQITIPIWISNTSSNYLSRRSVLVGVVLLSKQKPSVFCPAKHIMFLFDCFHPFTFYLSDVLARRLRRVPCVSLQIWTHPTFKKIGEEKSATASDFIAYGYLLFVP